MAASSLGEHDFNSVHIFTLTFLSMVLASLRSHKGLVKKKNPLIRSCLGIAAIGLSFY